MLDFYEREFYERFQVAPENHDTDLKHARAMLDRYGWPLLQEFLRLYLDDDEDYLVKAGHPLGLLRRRIAKYAEAVNPRSGGKPKALGQIVSKRTAENLDALRGFMEAHRDD